MHTSNYINQELFVSTKKKSLTVTKYMYEKVKTQM
jgi:hypothetical protein